MNNLPRFIKSLKGPKGDLFVPASLVGDDSFSVTLLSNQILLKSERIREYITCPRCGSDEEVKFELDPFGKRNYYVLCKEDGMWEKIEIPAIEVELYRFDQDRFKKLFEEGKIPNPQRGNSSMVRSDNLNMMTFIASSGSRKAGGISTMIYDSSSVYEDLADESEYLTENQERFQEMAEEAVEAKTDRIADKIVEKLRMQPLPSRVVEVDPSAGQSLREAMKEPGGQNSCDKRSPSEDPPKREGTSSGSSTRPTHSRARKYTDKVEAEIVDFVECPDFDTGREWAGVTCYDVKRAAKEWARLKHPKTYPRTAEEFYKAYRTIRDRNTRKSRTSRTKH